MQKLDQFLDELTNIEYIKKKKKEKKEPTTNCHKAKKEPTPNYPKGEIK